MDPTHLDSDTCRVISVSSVSRLVPSPATSRGQHAHLVSHCAQGRKRRKRGVLVLRALQLRPQRGLERHIQRPHRPQDRVALDRRDLAWPSEVGEGERLTGVGPLRWASILLPHPPPPSPGLPLPPLPPLTRRDAVVVVVLWGAVSLLLLWGAGARNTGPSCRVCCPRLCTAIRDSGVLATQGAPPNPRLPRITPGRCSVMRAPS